MALLTAKAATPATPKTATAINAVMTAFFLGFFIISFEVS